MFLSYLSNNNASYTFFILFIKKFNKGLQFYVNYYKLNAIIKKDNYFILLI